MNGIAEALLNPKVYDEEIHGDIKLLQTHISYVFLTGKYAYKIKKPVDFGFLDFTTLEKRKFYCDEELRLNRRLCSEVYLDVVPIVRTREGLRIGGKGEIVEYAVKMKQLPQEAIMSSLLARGLVFGEHVERIAKLLVDFHAKASTGKGVDEYGAIEQVAANWVQNFEQTRALRGSIVKTEEFDYVETRVMGFLQRKKDLFRERVANGRIRECHGDVHSGNIFIAGEDICIFDAIEFNKAFSCSDVAAEVAFLAMDLEFHGRRDLADRFVGKYLEGSGDEELLELLPFYKCYRAYVRSKVSSFKLSDPAVREEEKRSARDLTERYFQLALRYARAL